jgi:RNA polymerase sigma factor (sigma-70 family)
VTQPAPSTPHPQSRGSVPDPATLSLLRNGVFLIALHELRDRSVAEEVAQETVARLLDALARRGEMIADVATFARGIARHIIADVRRDVARGESLDAVSNSPRHAVHVDPLAAAVRDDERRRLHLAFQSLSSADRETIRALFGRELSPGQLAARWGEPAERLRKRKSRALERLRRAFFGHDPQVAPTETRAAGTNTDHES